MNSQLPSEETAYTCKCGQQKLYLDCWQCCGEGFSHHDCGDDTCCCLDPSDNVTCDICKGKGGYHVCAACHPESFDE